LDPFTYRNFEELFQLRQVKKLFSAESAIVLQKNDKQLPVSTLAKDLKLMRRPMVACNFLRKPQLPI